MSEIAGVEELISNQKKWVTLEEIVKDIRLHVLDYMDEGLYRDVITNEEPISDEDLSRIYLKYRKDHSLDKLNVKLSKEVKKRLGLNVKFPYYVGEQPYSSVHNYQLYNAKKTVSLSEYFTNLNNETDLVYLYKGDIDIAKAKVKGDYAEKENRVYMDWVDCFITRKAKPPEVTWVVLHELGHCYDGAYQAYRGTSFNSLLNDLEYIKSSKVTLKEFNNRGKILGITLPSEKIKDPKQYKIVLANNINIKLSNELEDLFSNFIDDEEVRADAFAHRFGYGAYSALAIARFGGDLKDYRGISLESLQKVAVKINNVVTARDNSLDESIFTKISNFFTTPTNTQMLSSFKPFKGFIERITDAKLLMLDRLDWLQRNGKYKELIAEVKETLKAIDALSKVLDEVENQRPSLWDVSRYVSVPLTTVAEVRALNLLYTDLLANNLRVAEHRLRVKRA